MVMAPSLLKRFKEFYRPREADKRFFLALSAVTGAVFFWRGLWEVIDQIPFINEPFMSLAIGLAVMTFSGMIYREYGEEEPTMEIAQVIEPLFKRPHTHRKTITIHYQDNITNKIHSISHTELLGIEHDYLLLSRANQEFFIPLRRIREVRQKRKIIWKKGAVV